MARSLRTRRDTLRGLSARTARAWASRRFVSLGIGRRATVVLPLPGANNDIAVYAVAPGTAGNSVTVAVAVGGTAPTVAYAGNAVTVTAPASATAVQVIDALNRSYTTDAFGRTVKLIQAQLAPGQDGSGTVATGVAAQTLTGGTIPG